MVKWKTKKNVLWCISSIKILVSRIWQDYISDSTKYPLNFLTIISFYIFHLKHLIQLFLQKFDKESISGIYFTNNWRLINTFTLNFI